VRKAPNPKIFIGLALGTFIAGAGINYMTYSGLQETQQKVADLKNQVRPASEVQADLDRSNKDLVAMSDQLKHLEAGLPDFAYVPTMLAELEQAGKANGIEVSGVRPTPPPAVNPKAGEKQERKPYDELIIEVKGHGRYPDVMKFVDALQKFPKIVAVRTLSLTPRNDPETKDKQLLDITIELKAFIFQPPKTPNMVPGSSTAALQEVRHEG
jgi:type IV pilus assembly protein PilO